MDSGMAPLRTYGWNKVRDGQTTIEEVLRVTQIRTSRCLLMMIHPDLG